MYKVTKNGKTQKTAFETYEAARQYIRKQARKIDAGFPRQSGQPEFPMAFYGFGIKHVN
jgi:hypothetical protein